MHSIFKLKEKQNKQIQLTNNVIMGLTGDLADQ